LSYGWLMFRPLKWLILLWTLFLECWLFPLVSRAAIINSPDYFIQSMGIPDGLPHEVVHHVI